jgi:hypothetical protein
VIVDVLNGLNVWNHLSVEADQSSEGGAWRRFLFSYDYWFTARILTESEAAC